MQGKKMTLKERLEKLEIDKAERRKLAKAYCDHLAEGLSKLSFSEVHFQTVERYIKAFPEEFSAEEIALAEIKGRETWERLGKRQASGECLGNSRTWFYNMANRYGWRERIDIEAEHKGAVDINIVSYASLKHCKDTSEQ